MFGRLPIRDWILLFICGWIIAHANWPTGAPIRIVTIHRSDGETGQYTLDANAPQVAIIQERIKNWDRQVTPVALVIARWRLELADFYCRDGNRVDSQPDTNVAQVAFESNPMSPHTNDYEYWQIVRDKTATWIEETESHLETSRQVRGESPIRLGAVQAGPVGWAGNLCSALIGLMLASGLCLWSLTNPAIELTEPTEHPRRSSLEGSSSETRTTIKVEIPAQWVRINQPTSVKLRRCVVATIILAAVFVQLTALA